MRRAFIVIMVAILAVLPTLAAGMPPDGGAGGGMRAPQQLLMMAFHRNVANFGQALYLASEQGETLSPVFARTAVAEMRRSTEEMEKQRAALRDQPVDQERQKLMEDHLVQVKKHLRELEALVQKERIDSAEVRKLLVAIFQECEGAGCEMLPPVLHRWRGYGAPGYGAMTGCECPSPAARHGGMMQRMMQKVKRQDAELSVLVRELKGASGDRKVDLLVETVTTMVEQRAEMTAEMERMVGRHAGMAPEDEDEEEYDEEDEGH